MSESLINQEHVQPKDTRRVRLIIMLVMVLVYMVAELIVGIVGNSLTLVGDAFHMLSDLLSLIIGLVSLILGKKKASYNATFGYKRSETIGGFFNASFLMSTAFFLFTEAIQKLISMEGINIETANLILGVAIGGLIVNIIGIFIFHEHGDGKECNHGHHHGHSHSDCHSVDSANDKDIPPHADSLRHIQCKEASVDVPTSESCVREGTVKSDKKHNHGKKKGKPKDIAMHGVFIHVLGDLMGSIIAIVSTLIQMFVKHPLARIVDPLTTFLMIIIIVCAAIPLMKSTIKILIQTTPANLSIVDLKESLLEIDGVLGVHDLHIWTFTDETVIGHCHVVLCNPSDFVDRTMHSKVMKEIKSTFHNMEVHNVTVEMEYVTMSEKTADVCFSSYGCLSQKKKCCNYETKIIS